jgi:hypothetical protein
LSSREPVSQRRSIRVERADALAVSDGLGPQLAGDVVLIGGQAIAFWRARLDPWLSPEAIPQDAIASSDIDFTGSAEVNLAARMLNGTARVAPPRTPTSESGMVTCADSDGTERIIDFLSGPYGLQGADVLKDAVPVPLIGPGAPMTLKVTHPLHCLLSRVSNTALANTRTVAPSVSYRPRCFWCQPTGGRFWTSRATHAPSWRPMRRSLPSPGAGTKLALWPSVMLPTISRMALSFQTK